MNERTYTHSLVAVFSDRATAEHARESLIQNGFGREQIELTAADEFASDAATGNTGLTGRNPAHTGGGVSGFFHRLFGDNSYEDDRQYYSNAMTKGRSAVIVHATDEALDRAADILNDNGAVRIDEESDTAARENVRSTDTGRGDTSIPVVREELRVGTRPVQRGGVRVYSQVTERPVEENIPLREESVRVDRRAVDRPATEADLAAASRGVIEVTETVEEPVIEKVARVVEEVVVTKDVKKRTKNVKDTVRQSDVRVEDARTGRQSNFSDADNEFREDFRTRYGAGGGRYEDYEPAYRYGYEAASDERYRGRRFEDIENDLRTDYQRRYPNSTWERMKESIRYGWDRMTRKR